MWRLGLLTACVAIVLAAATAAAAQQKAAGPPFAAGEVIVKFAPNSKAADVVASASTQNSVTAPELISYVESLSKTVGIPFAIERFASGGNVVVAIRRPDLLNPILNRLQATPGVKQACIVSAEARTAPSIEVEFAPGTREADILARLSKRGTESGLELHVISQQLERECGCALNARVLSPSKVLLTPDLNALTLELATRLARRADVAYAQPNFVRRPMGPAAELSPRLR